MGAAGQGGVSVETALVQTALVQTGEAASPISAVHYRRSEHTPPRAALVFAPGAGAGQHHAFVQGLATAVANHAIEVVTFDFPYRQAGRRAPDRPAVLEACFRDVVAWTRAAIGAGTTLPLFAGGKSMGGRIATHLATLADLGLAGAIAVGYPLKPPGGGGRDRTSHLGAMVCPLLVLQGTRDAFGAPADIQAAMARSPVPVTVVPIAGADHAFAVRGVAPAQVLDELGSHIARWVTQDRCQSS
jgi:predicted alpha/beta-hydrolase family hydrolase